MTPTQNGRRLFTQAEFEHVCRAHEQWLQDRHAGAQADFRDVDFGVLRIGAGLRLSGALFTGANLDGCSLAGADLRGCDLRETSGLTIKQLAGTNLAAARLPDTLQLSLALDKLSAFADLIAKLLIPLLAARANGGDFAPASVPILPPAPGRLSMMNEWPSRSDRL